MGHKNHSHHLPRSPQQELQNGNAVGETPLKREDCSLAFLKVISAPVKTLLCCHSVPQHAGLRLSIINTAPQQFPLENRSRRPLLLTAVGVNLNRSSRNHRI